MKKNIFFFLGIFILLTTASFAKDLKVGFIYVSPIGDAGYSYAHDLGRQEVAKLPGVKTFYLESIREGQDAERVLTNMARKGYNLIFATSFGYMDSVIKVAKRFPNVIFMHCSGFKRAKKCWNIFWKDVSGKVFNRDGCRIYDQKQCHWICGCISPSRAN